MTGLGKVHVGIPRPANWKIFEEMSIHLWRLVLDDPELDAYGRNGQKQQGIDLLGVRRTKDGPRLVGIQCKWSDQGNRPTEEDFIKDFEQALEIDPPLDEFIFTSTAANDRRMSNLAVRLAMQQRDPQRTISVSYRGWASLEREIRNHPTIAAYLDPNHSPVVDTFLQAIRNLGKWIAFSFLAIALIAAALLAAMRLDVFPFGLAPSYEEIFSTVRMSASRDKVLAELGHPAISSVPKWEEIPLRETRAVEVLGNVVQTEEVWGVGGEDRKAFVEAASALDFRADLYEFPDILVEVDYLDEVVVQYSIMLRTRKQFDLLSVTDLGWLRWNDAVVPHVVGGHYFSEYVPLWCTRVEAVSGSRDGWASLGCYPSKFTNELDLQFGYQERGASFSNPAATLTQSEESRFVASGWHFGFGMLAFSPPSSVNCGEYDTEPLVTQHGLDAAIAGLPDDAALESLLCMSLRLTQPNGVTVTDHNREYPSVVLPSGMTLHLSPSNLSRGLVSFSTFGFRRDAFFLSSQYVSED